MDSAYSPQLYLHDKYKVFIGRETNVALCTCWTDPNLLIKQHEGVLDHFALMGTLYSREGVSIILRNIALNPYIDTLLIWANNPLSKTAIGMAGRTLLKKVWSEGLDENHLIKSTSDRIHREIELETIETIRSKVKLLDLTESSFDEMLKETTAHTKRKMAHFMDALSFPEPKRETLSTFPSEHVGFSVHSQNLTGAWLKVVDKIVRYGEVKKTETGSNQKELQNITWTIQHEDIDNLTIPDWPDNVKSAVGLDKNILEQYKTIFIDPHKPEGTAYTYGNRLNDYLGKTNQIERIIEKLKDCLLTRQAYATTFYPPEDLFQTSPPCLTQIQLLSSEGSKLNMFATFRSHDILKAAIPNAYGLLNLQRHIVRETGYDRGSLTITSVSAHIYEEDWQTATDIVKCGLWERTKLYFDEHEDLDPRGMFRLSLLKGKIHIEIVTPDGTELFSYDGASAREVAMKIARLDLLSITTHYIDLSIELTKAELALKNGMEYIQDRPLIMGSVIIK